MTTAKSNQQAGDNSIVVTSSGSVSIVTGLSASDVQVIVREMLRESLSGLQKEAKLIAEARNEELLSHLLTQAEDRFGEKLEERLAGFVDPGAQISYRHAQIEYCKYGSEDTKLDAIELIISRLDEAESIDEKIIFDEAIQRAGRVNKRQLDFLCFQLLGFHVRDATVTSMEAFERHLRRLTTYLGGLEASNAELAMLSSLGLVGQFHGLREWRKFNEVIQQNYAGFLMKGFDPEPLENIGPVPDDLLVPCLRDGRKFQANHALMTAWKRKVGASELPEEKKIELIALVEASVMNEDEVWAELIRVEPVFEKYSDQLKGPDSVYRSLNLTPVAKAVALARLRRDGWTKDIQLKHIL